MRAAHLTLLCVLVACSSGKKIGDACSNVGKTDECTSGAVCSQQDKGGAVCLPICSQQTDCPSGDECDGVDNSNLKACRPKVK